MNEGDTVTVVAMLALIGGSLIAILIAVSRGKAREKKADAKRQKAIDYGVKIGACDENGMPLCAVCRKLGDDVEAIEHTPVTGRKLWDSLPFVSKRRELWAQPARDVVIDDIERGLRLCRNHKAMAVRNLSEVYAGCRAQTSTFNAEQREKIDYMDSGGTEAMVFATSKKIRDALGFEDPLSAMARPQLTSSTESVALPVSSSTEKTSESEE